jgi:hypothetical protein
MRKIILAIALLVSACANPYSQFYRGTPDARLRPDYLPTTDELKIYSTNDMARDIKTLMRKGFLPIGESSFNAGTGSVSRAQLRKHAQKIGAHAVLISSRFTHSVSGAIPLAVPTTTTSYSTGTGTAYGPRGSITAYGTGSTTTYGTETTWVPYTVNRADFNAVYFVKAKAQVGIFAEALDDETRRRLETNSGVRVGVVAEGSPAFEADVLPGDILILFGGQAVRSVEHYHELLRQFTGNSVELVLNRDGRVLTKVIPFRKL